MRVFGPPGTGKTTYLGRQIQRAVEEVGKNHVLVASFTKTAAAEIGSRDTGISERQVGTLHSFANRAIGGSNIVEDKAGLTEWNDLHWRDDRRLSVGTKHEELDFEGDQNKTEGDRLFAEYKWLRAKMTPREAWPPAVLAFGADWETFKRTKKGIDFTDQIELALNEQLVPPGDWGAAFFDEVQDFSPLELAYARLIGNRCEYFILGGDPNQCIFSFKGATPEAFLYPELPMDQVRVLNQSWRVPAAVHRFAAGWQLIPLTYSPKEEEGRVDTVPLWSVRDLEYSPFIEEAQRVVAEGKTVMFLTSAGYMLRSLITGLKRAGLPFGNAYRPEQAEWNPLKSSKAWDPASKVKAFLRDCPEVWGAAARKPTYAELWQAVEHLDFGGFKPGAKALLKSAAADRLMRDRTVDDARDYLPGGAFQGDAVSRLRWFVKNTWFKKQESLLYLLNVVERHGWEVLERPAPVTVGNIHSVKGGQSSVVYLFPELSPSAQRAWEGCGEHRNAIIRTYYVGATRAQERLVLCGVEKSGVNWNEYHARMAAFA
jgi:DNA helicase-2/ATP-dependent DNA helicase PcrA